MRHFRPITSASADFATGRGTPTARMGKANGANGSGRIVRRYLRALACAAGPVDVSLNSYVHRSDPQLPLRGDGEPQITRCNDGEDDEAAYWAGAKSPLSKCRVLLDQLLSYVNRCLTGVE